MAPRIAVMIDGLDIGRMTGLEIGPLCYPIVRHCDGDITYVDYTDTESLRRSYANRPIVDVADMVDVDVVWGDRTLLECMGGRTVDYAIASHVAEHVPDLITWLAEMRDVLKPDGELRLALPDRRFSHDALRQETRLSDLLAAWLTRARRPQIRDVLDFRLNTATGARGYELYAGLLNIEDVRPDHTFAVALQAGISARDNPEQYFDVHCMAVQAGGFARLMAELAEAGLLKLACSRMIDTSLPLFEFYAFMKPCDDAQAAAASWRAAEARMQDPLPGSAAARAAAQNSANMDELRRALAQSEAELARLQQSLSWRLTAPLRHMRAASARRR